MEPLVTLRDLERRLEVTKETLYRWIKDGRLKATRLPNGHWRVTEETISQILGLK